MDVNVDFLSSDAWDSRMHERMRWLRENDPVHWSEKSGLWIVSKYEDVAYVSKHNDLFCSGQGVRPGNPVRLTLIEDDEPRHGQLRRLINKGFTPRMVGKLEEKFRVITKEAIDKVAAAGECDFVEDIAVPLPLLLIAEMIGIRKEDREAFHRWSDALVAGDGNFEHPEIMANAAMAYNEYGAYVTEIFEDRRRNPQDDLVSILVGANDEGLLTKTEFRESGRADMGLVTELASDELVMFMVLLLVAGNETTRNAIAGGMSLLIENPGERRKLLDDPSLLGPAVEEMIRVVSPVHSFGRTATRDTELRGKKIKKDERVLVLYPSANRDADVFEDPDTFKIERNPAHLGFGIGNHFCLGANLARMEMRVAFSELLRRLPDMEYADDGPELKPSALVRSCVRMKVRYTPERSARPGERQQAAT